nr:carboxypeptidase regulatory-like domain-containing protein [Rhodoferax sp.]
MQSIARAFIHCLVFLTGVVGIALPSQAQATPEVTRGLTWLTAQVQANGSLLGEPQSIATSLQNRTEAAYTFKLLATTPARLLTAIAADTDDNTEYLSRKAISLAVNGVDASAHIITLLSRQNPDSGFGAASDFTSNPVDTAWTVLALAQSNNGASDAAVRARAYLVSLLGPDGGMLSPIDANRVHVSALTLLALQTTTDGATATAARTLTSWLLLQQDADGGWLHDTYGTAITFAAVSPLTADVTVRTNVRNYLFAKQATDGSWGEDPFLTALVLRALSVQYTAPSTTTGMVKGLVVDQLSNAPLSGATVTFTGPQNKVVATDTSGVFSVNSLTAGTYGVVYSRSGYNNASGSVVVNSGQTSDLGTVKLLQLATTGILRGQVTSVTTSLPMAGVNVAISGAASGNKVTDADGRYEVVGLAPGASTVTASFAGYQTATGSGTVVAGQTLVFSPTLYPNGQTPGTSIRYLGKVVSAGSNTPLAGVSIQVTGTAGTFTATTTAAGQFDVAMAAGSYKATYTLAGYTSVTQTFVGSGGATIDAGGIALAPNRTASSIKGKVLNASSVGISGATLQIVGGAQVVTTAADGSYSIGNLTGTSFVLRASATGFNSQSINLQVSQPTDIQQDFTLAAQSSGTFVIGNMVVTPPTVGRATDVTTTTTITNTSASDDSVSVQLQVIDQNQKVIGRGVVYDTSGNLIGQLMIPAGQQQTVRLVWNSAQYPAGNYTLDVRLLKPGSITMTLPQGVLLTERSASVAVTAQAHFTGSITANPPVLQAGTNTAITLSAAIQNDGNTNFVAQTLTLSAIDTRDGSIAHTDQASVSVLAVNALQTLAFQDWTPAIGGSYRLELTATDSSLGKVIGTLYIGDAARASYTTNKVVVPTGTQAVRATVQVTGQDVTNGSISDPLAPLIKTAVQNATRFNYITAAAETVADRCTRCHVQAQALVSGELTRKITNYDSFASYREIILNSLTTHQQADGAIDGHTSLGISKHDQSEFAIWALNTWHNASEIASTIVKLSKFLVDTQNADGTWSADSSGWWTSAVPHASLNIKGLTDAAKTISGLVPGSARNYTLTPVSNVGDGPYNLVSDAAGNVYSSNYWAGTVQMIKPDSTSQSFMTGLSNPTGVAFASNGTVYASTSAGLYRRNPDGTGTQISPRPGSGLAIGPDGNIYMSSYWNNKIYRFTPAGAESTYVDGGALGNPWGITFTPAGDLLVANFGKQNIVRYHPDLTNDVPVGWTNAGVYNIQMTSNGWLVTTDRGLYSYNTEWHGERLLYTAMGGVTQTPDGNIYVGNVGDNTVSKLTSTPIDTSALLAGMDTAIGKTTTWLMQDSNTDANNNLFLAQRLIGLNAAKLYYLQKSNPLADTLQAKMVTVADQLRSHVGADGGWGYGVGYASDSMVTAQVGVALDSLNPSATDPIVQNAVRLLLSRQRADGTWYSENGIMSTPLAATTWVAIWLPIVLDRLGGIDSDLSVTFPANVKMTNPDLAPTSTTVNTDGTTTNVWKLTGVTSAARSVNYDLSLVDMAVNEVRPVSIDAHLTFRNSFTGGVVNAQIDVPRVTASGFLGLGVTTDRLSYPADTLVNITGQVNNTGATLLSGSVKFEIYAPDNKLVASVGSMPFSGLAAGGNVNVPIVWNTAKTIAGADYYVVGSLYDSTNSFVGSAKAKFAIQSNQAQSDSARITSDRVSYTGAQTVQLTALVTNLTANSVQSNLVARTTVLSSGGQSVFSQSETIAQLVAGGLRQYTYNLIASSLAPGVYTTQLQLLDAQSAVLAQSAGTFTVQSTDQSGVGLSGSLQANPTSTVVGSTVTISATALNQGNADLTNVPLTVSIVDPGSQKLIASWPYTASVARSKSFAIATTWKATGSAPTTTYVVVLGAIIGGKSVTLASTNLVVTAPSVKLDITQRTLRQGRLLVLLSCRNGEDHYSEQSGNDVRNTDRGDDDDHCNNTRATFLNNLLTGASVQHLVTANVDDFAYAMRSGQYNIYWIAGGADKLSEGLAQEIREAVNRGDGLLVEGIHDERNKLLDEVVGLQYRGKLQAVNQPIVFTMAPLTGKTLQTTGRALKLKLGNGALVAKFPGGIACRDCDDDDERKGSSQTDNTAIAGYVYGRGKGVVMAFDLIGSIQNHASDPNWVTAVQLAFDFLTQDAPTTYTSGAYAAVRTTTTNQGVATDLNVTQTLPAGAKAVGSEPSAVVSKNGLQAQWNYTLPAGQSKDLTLYLRLPASTGSYTLGTAVSSVSNSLNSLYGSYSLALQVTAASEPVVTSKLIADLKALSLSSSRDRQNRDQTVRALQDAATQSRPDRAITNLLDAVDQLNSITGKDVSAYRLQIDGWLQELALKWQAAQPVRNIH